MRSWGRSETGIAILGRRSFGPFELQDRMIDAMPLNSSACEQSERTLESNWHVFWGVIVLSCLQYF